MRRRELGATGLEVSELGLGTWGLCGDGYGPVEEGEQDRVIERARAAGITTFETADSYAYGEMEARLGRLLGDDPALHVVTKLGTSREARVPRKRFDRAFLGQAFDRSQERLRRDCVSLVLLHNPSASALERGEATSLMKELREAGRIRAWGVSAGSPAAARAAIDQGAQVIELAYNPFCTSLLRELEPAIDSQRVGLLVHSVLAYGLLCGTWSSDKQFPVGDHRSERWTADELRLRIRQLDALRPLLGKDVPSLRAAALRYALTNPRVGCAVLGPRSAGQLDQLVREAGRGPPYLPRAKMAALESRLSAFDPQL